MKLKWFGAGFLSACILCVCCVLAYQSLNAPPKPDLPTQEYVREHGYPVNESGETYGPNVDGFEEPDLILARTRDGLRGYLKRTEDPGDWVHNPDEAMRYVEETRTICRNHYRVMYLEDGKTPIGLFPASCQACGFHITTNQQACGFRVTENPLP